MIQHEMVSYPFAGDGDDECMSIAEFLEDEVMDDSFYTHEDVDVERIYEFLSTHSAETPGRVKVLSMSDLEMVAGESR